MLYLGRKACGWKLQELGDRVGGIDDVSFSARVKRLEVRGVKEAVVGRMLPWSGKALQIQNERM